MPDFSDSFSVNPGDLAAFLNLPEGTNDAAMLAVQIAAAERYLERFTGKVFITQTLTAVFDCFPATLQLPRAPVQSIASIKYLDAERAEQTLAAEAYFASPLNSDRPTLIYPAIGASWPATADVAGAVTVSYVAGYADAADAEDVPEPLRQAVRMLAAHFYENREATLVGVNAQELPLGVHDLVRDYRAWSF